MASLDVTLAWSVPVPVEILGAHLQAYVLLQPAIRMIRLCNRFGKGPQAAITKLPIEIVTEIEAYLSEHEREEQRHNWKTDFTCFQGLCSPLDHMSDTERVGLWQDFFTDCPHCGGCSCSTGKDMSELNERQLQALEEMLDSMMRDEGPEESPWWIEHQNRCCRWLGKTGNKYPNDRRGLLGHYSHDLKRDFGLQVWVTHTQPKIKKQPSQFTTHRVFDSTIAYLTFPSCKNRHTFERAFSDGLASAGESPHLATQSGDGVDVDMPSELSPTDIFRFSRAIKMLGLTPEDSTNPKPALWASFDDHLSASEKERKSKTADGLEADRVANGTEAKKQPGQDASKIWTPKLSFLFSQAVDDDDY